jgi:hypothetical protein
MSAAVPHREVHRSLRLCDPQKALQPIDMADLAASIERLYIPLFFHP